MFSPSTTIPPNSSGSQSWVLLPRLPLFLPLLESGILTLLVAGIFSLPSLAATAPEDDDMQMILGL